MYRTDVPYYRRNTASIDFKDIDQAFRINRDSVHRRMISDQERDPVDFILLDRWTMSAVVYSKLRFADISKPQDEDYY